MKNNNFLDKVKKFEITKKWMQWLIAPIAIIIVALVVFLAIGGTSGSWAEGLNLGIDFQGGTILKVQIYNIDTEGLDANYNKHVSEITRVIESNGVKVSYVQLEGASVETESYITFRYANADKDDDAIAARNNEIRAAIAEHYEVEDADSFIKYESVGSTARNDLVTKSILAIVISAVLILIYILIRFRASYAVAVIIGLMHDVLVMFALTIICRIQINSSFIAAAITIIGYSVNNTIVIFDRSREIIKTEFKGIRNLNYFDIGDRAIRETFRRTLYSTFTTLITIVVLAIMSGATLREFSLPIIFGLIAAFYSSILLSTSIWSRLSYTFDKINAKRAKQAEYDGATTKEELKKAKQAKRAEELSKASLPVSSTGRPVLLEALDNEDDNAEEDSESEETEEEPKKATEPAKPASQKQVKGSSYKAPYKKKYNKPSGK